MKRRRILLLGVLVAIAAAVVFLAWPRGPVEPVYRGERLSEWLNNLTPTTFDHPPSRDRAKIVIREFGTNALPWLLHEFTRSVPKLRMAFNLWVAKNTRWRYRPDDGQRRISLASRGLELLGPAVTPALPELARCLGDPTRGILAASLMAGAGEYALPYFIKGLASTNAAGELAAVFGLAKLANDIPAAIPPLVQALQTTNDRIRLFIVRSLGMNLHPEWIIPALSSALSDPNQSVRIEATRAFAEARTNSMYVEKLHRLLQGTNAAIASAASNALFILENPAPPPPAR